MNSSDLRKKDIKELNEELSKLRRDKFKLSLSQAEDNFNKSHLFKQVKRNIARLMTIINEKNLLKGNENEAV